jgi:hypothetical protein
VALLQQEEGCGLVFEGWLKKTQRKGSADKERYVRINGGELRFFDGPETPAPRKVNLKFTGLTQNLGQLKRLL